MDTLSSEFLSLKAEADALGLEGDSAAAYVSEQKRIRYQQELAERDQKHQQELREESHHLTITQQTEMHDTNRERSEEMHYMNLEESKSKSQAAKLNFKLKLQPLSDDEKVEDYLAHFERLATLHGWDKETWSLQLAPYLQGKSRSAYNRLPTDSIDDWDKVKSAILAEFHLSAAEYRIQFKQATRLPDEPLRTFFERLSKLQERWLLMLGADEQDLPFLLIREKFKESLPESQQIFMGQRELNTREELIQAAEAYEQIKQEQVANRKASGNERQGPKKRIPSGTSSDTKRQQGEKQGEKRTTPRGCFICGAGDHRMRDCPKKKPQGSTSSKSGYNPNCTVNMLLHKNIPALRDTGSTEIFVPAKFIRPHEYIQETRNVMGYDGKKEQRRVASTYIDCPFVKGWCDVVVTPWKSPCILIGNSRYHRGYRTAIPITPVHKCNANPRRFKKFKRSRDFKES